MTKRILIIGLAVLLMTACNVDNSPGPFENPSLAKKLVGTNANETSTLFIQMADTQIGLLTRRLSKYSLGLIGGDYLYEQESKNYSAAIEFANRISPSFVVICGDLVQALSHPAQKDEFQRITKHLDPSIPLYLVSGNHDVGNEPTKEYLSQYRNAYGPDWYSFQHKGIYGIVLNSSLINNPNRAKNEAAIQRTWLENELLKANQKSFKHILIFQHHPYFREDPDEGDSAYFTINTSARKEYLDLFVAHGVEAVFAGHLHENALGQYKNLKMITTSAIGIASPIGKSRTGLRVVQTKPDNLDHAFIAIDDLF